MIEFLDNNKFRHLVDKYDGNRYVKHFTCWNQLPQFGIRIVHKKLVVSQIFCTFIGDLQQVTNIFDMTTDYKVTELFCIIDEFCKHFDAENAGNLLEDGVKRRRCKASLSDIVERFVTLTSIIIQQPEVILCQ